MSQYPRYIDRWHGIDPANHYNKLRGDTQCPFVTQHGGPDEVLCCALRHGHACEHIDAYGYTHGTWTLP